MAIKKGWAINHKTREVEVVQKVNEPYTILICCKCKIQEEFKGCIIVDTLPNNWSVMTIEPSGPASIYQWLLCPTCIEEVRKAAGL